MKDLAFFTMLVSFCLAAFGSPSWGWFLFVALIFGVFA